MLNKNNKLNRQINTQAGFTLMELIVTTVLIAIIASATIGLYLQGVYLYRRQQRILQVERSLLETHNSLKESLVALPGRNLGVDVQGFSIPSLPAAGSIFNPATGKNEAIQLGLVTPYQVNGNDAFMVVYADGKFPRLPISETTLTSNDLGVAKVPLPFLTQSTLGDDGNGNGKLDKTLASAGKLSFSSNTSSNTGSNTGSSPSKLPPSTGTTVTGVPPNIPISQTLSGLAYYAVREDYNAGDLMLLIGAAPASIRLTPTGDIQTYARIVRLTNITPSLGSSIGSLNQQFIDFTYDLCLSGECDSKLPGITNLSITPTSFRVGSVLVPLRTACFYLKKDNMGSYLVRNDNGVILPSGDGTFHVVGGTESVLGEVDSLTAKYVLRNGSVQQSPINPNVPWLNQIVSVDISLLRGMPAVKGTESLTRSVNVNFPIIIKQLD